MAAVSTRLKISKQELYIGRRGRIEARRLGVNIIPAPAIIHPRRVRDKRDVRTWGRFGKGPLVRCEIGAAGWSASGSWGRGSRELFSVMRAATGRAGAEPRRRRHRITFVERALAPSERKGM